MAKEEQSAEEEMPFITLGLYADADAEIRFCGDEWVQHPKFLEEVYSSCAEYHGEKYIYEAEGAPQCMKFSEMRKEGYTYFLNDSEDASIKEGVVYTMFDGLELVPPFSGTSYEVLVPSKSSRIVLMKQVSITGYNLSFSYTSNIIFTTEAMKKRIKIFGIKVIRKDIRVNSDTDICVFSLKHGGGICYLYENNTINSTLEEHVKFKTTGLEILGSDSNEIAIKIGPGESN